MTSKIKHKGTVRQVSPGMVQVLILQASACLSCEAKKLCSSSEKKEKIIEIATSDAESYKVGEEVLLEGALSQGLHAAVLAYVLPLVWLLIVLFFLIYYTRDEALAALGSILSLLPYYILLYLMRGRLARNFSFTLKHIN